MNKWMLRGLVFAAAMVVLRLFQGALINAWQTQSALISIVLLTLFVIASVLWGLRDGRADAKSNPDPDRREDLAMIWLLAGLAAGLVSGLVAWIIALFYKGIYTGGLLNELTTFAAFTALLVFVFGILGVAVGRWRIDRKAPPPEKHDGSHDRQDTDVFSAVREDESPTGEIPRQSQGGAQTEERTSPVATAERDEPTQVIRTGDRGSEDKTEVIRTGDSSEAKTEVLNLDEATRPHKKSTE
ncbi:B-4DMT family transporter [Mycobacterium asiaticum]|uniref:B-4DMT family transporter n=1 Tax=Mycobacterium asiaticum TaxID=1790 RepID=UPI0009BFB1D7|nr:B-4DMT family transporter [Mycobacterium asiaticum]